MIMGGVIVARMVMTCMVMAGRSRLRRHSGVVLMGLRGLLEDLGFQDQRDGAELLGNGNDETNDETGNDRGENDRTKRAHATPVSGRGKRSSGARRARHCG